MQHAPRTEPKEQANQQGKLKRTRPNKKHLRIFFSLFARKRKGAPANDEVSNSDHPRLSFLKPVCTMLVLPSSCCKAANCYHTFMSKTLFHQAKKSKFCEGSQGKACTFGRENQAQPKPKRDKRCLFCDIKRLNAQIENKKQRGNVARQFNKLTPDNQKKALARIQNPIWQQWLGHRHKQQTVTEPYTKDELKRRYQQGHTLWHRFLKARPEI